MWKKKQNKFPGGIHPTDGYDKAMTMDLPVHEYCLRQLQFCQSSLLAENVSC